MSRVTRGEVVEVRGLGVQRLEGVRTFKNVAWTDLDFSDARAESIRFFGAAIRGCRFDRAACQDWRLWATEVRDSSFIEADLSDSSLGGSRYEGRQCEYGHVRFSRANLRGIHSNSTTFTDCDFGGSRLVNVEFRMTKFLRCRFQGTLRDVVFHGWDYKTDENRPDLLVEVDFSGAEFHGVEFRRLNLDGAQFPSGKDHLVVRHYRCVLERAIETLPVDGWKGFRAVLAHHLKWIGPNQSVGVFSRYDFVEWEGESKADAAIEVLRRLETECENQPKTDSHCQREIRLIEPLASSAAPEHANRVPVRVEGPIGRLSTAWRKILRVFLG